MRIVLQSAEICKAVSGEDMDPALLQQRRDFQKRAAENVIVSQQPQPSTSNDSHTTYNSETAKKKKKTNAQPAGKSNADFDSKSAQSSSNAANFGTMAKIVNYMKKRHLNNQPWALTLKEIQDELQLDDLSKKAEQWLTEALPTNPRLHAGEEGKFTYQPPYKIKCKSSLVAVAKKYHIDAKGGILLAQLNECIPEAEKVLESLGKEIIVAPALVNERKDKVFFWNDPEVDFEMDEEFKALWRNVSVDHLDEKKIEEYLQTHGIDTMKDLAPKKHGGPPKRKTPKRKFNGKVHNDHLDGVLEEYD